MIEREAIEAVVQRVLPGPVSRIEAATGGSSTLVYRIVSGHETYYLRFLPDPDDTFAAEYAIHTRLRQLDVRVPDIIYYAPFDETVQCSFLITGEIKGQPVMQSAFLDEATLKAIAREAGQDLARINSVPVRKHGRLRELKSADDLFLTEAALSPRSEQHPNWQNMLSICHGVLSSQELDRLERALQMHDTGDEQWYLMHGDFSIRHIYQENGRYTGIIDLTDAQGASRWEDIGYFHLRDRLREAKVFPLRLETELLEGYQEVMPLSADYRWQVCFASLRLALLMLADQLQCKGMDAFAHALVRVIREDVEAVLWVSL
uniref:Aminoglycoside phosphotransferase domain-containing protein n=1 Tax=Thermosporothrix sp. COM3 TaxID=2490863 RepID=A0A455SJM4_9CHLR|nr:hypothetical protein KTC_23090 [Thermosporothrix sp. COM3]